MTLRLNGSTSGYAEIDAPAVAGSNTLVLPASNGSAYQFLRNGATAGTTEFAAAITSGTAVASTSGTSIDFTGIPSYVKRVTVMFSGVSFDTSSDFLIQLGDSGGVEASSYVSTSMLTRSASTGPATSTSGMIIQSIGSTPNHTGHMVITTMGSNLWVSSHYISESGNTATFYGAGTKTLSGTLDRIRITSSSGSATFDAGSINILYEG